jgi:hypothetical protein
MAINLALTDINCGPNLQGNNVVCESDIIIYHNYLVQFINSFVNSTMLSLGDTFTTEVTQEDIMIVKKQIFQICSTGERYPEFSQYMLDTATKVGVGVPPILFSIFDVGQPGEPTLLTRSGQVEKKIVNLFVMGVSLHLLGLKSWALDFELKPTDRPRLIDTIVLAFPIRPEIVQGYVIQKMQLIGFEIAVQGPKHPVSRVRLMPDAPVVRQAVDATSRGMKHIKNPMHELLLHVSNFFAVGGGTGNIRTDLTRSHGPTLNYRADTNVQEPPNPFSGPLAPGTMIWNKEKKFQLMSTKLYLSTKDHSDGHDVEILLRPINGMGHVRELYIFDKKNRQKSQHWRVTNTNDGGIDNYVEYDVIFEAEGSTAWGANNGDECEVVVLRDGQIVPPPSARLSREFHRFMGGAKKQNKSKRRKQKRSNKKKSRHYNRNNRKRFY